MRPADPSPASCTKGESSTSPVEIRMMVSGEFSSRRQHDYHRSQLGTIPKEDAPTTSHQKVTVEEESRDILVKKPSSLPPSECRWQSSSPRDSGRKSHPKRRMEEQLRKKFKPSSLSASERRRHSYPRNSPKSRPRRTVEGEEVREVVAPPLVVAQQQKQARSPARTSMNPHIHRHHQHPRTPVPSSSDSADHHLLTGMHYRHHRSPPASPAEYYHDRHHDPPSTTCPINKRALEEALQKRAGGLEAFDIVKQSTASGAPPPHRAQKPVEIPRRPSSPSMNMSPRKSHQKRKMDEHGLVQDHQFLKFDIVKPFSIAAPLLHRRHSSPILNRSPKSHQKRTLEAFTPTHQNSQTQSSSASRQIRQGVKVLFPKPERLAKEDMLIDDTEVLKTRLEWTQLIMNDALLPYRHMICEADENLTDIKDLDRVEQSSLYKDNPVLLHVRNEMLHDPDLSEREIAAFFEGCQLYQLKVKNSLQVQLDNLKTIQERRSGTSFLAGPSAERSITPTPNKSDSKRMSSFQDTMNKSIAVVTEDGNESLQGSSSRMEPREKKSSDTVESVDTENDPNRRQAMHMSNTTTIATNTTNDETLYQNAVMSFSGLGSLAHSPSNASQPTRSPRNMLRLNSSLREISKKRVRDSKKEGNEKVHELLKELDEAENRIKKLEMRLSKAGVEIFEDIPYKEAKSHVLAIAVRMNEIGGSNVVHEDPKEQAKLRGEYFKLEQGIEKYTATLELTEEWIREQDALEKHWEESVLVDNEEALKKVRRHMPVEVRIKSEKVMSIEPTPNGKVLPKEIAKRFKRTDVLQLLRDDPEDIVRMHPSTLENMRVTGLTLMERRALYAHLKVIEPRWMSMKSDKMTKRKWIWYCMMKNKFKESLDIWQCHVDEYGYPGAHPYSTRQRPNEGCPLIGRQCPLKADEDIDYSGNFGYPQGPEFRKYDIRHSTLDDPESKARLEALELARTRQGRERSDILKHHYNGNILQVFLANSCEITMNEAMDLMEQDQEKIVKMRLNSADDFRHNVYVRNEISEFYGSLQELKMYFLQFADRSGLQLTGKKDSNADKPDTRSVVELSLCEELIETAKEFFKGLDYSLNERGIFDKLTAMNTRQLRQLLDELHERNVSSLKRLGNSERPERSRPLKTWQFMNLYCKRDMDSDRRQPTEDVVPTVVAKVPPKGHTGKGDGGRPSLMAAIAARAAKTK